MILNYHLFGFSLNYIIDDSYKTQYFIGWTYMATIGLLIVINMSFILYQAVKKAIRARQLKKMKKCSIQPPDWMTVGLQAILFFHSSLFTPCQLPKAYLTRHLKLEQDDDRYFQELPYAYAEVAKVILEK